MGENGTTEGKELSPEAQRAISGPIEPAGPTPMQDALASVADDIAVARTSSGGIKVMPPPFEQLVLEALTDILRRVKRIEDALP